MEVSVEDGRQVPDQAIVHHNAVIGNDRGARVDEDTLAKHNLKAPNKRPHVIDPAV
jgi:hypothetical protein